MIVLASWRGFPRRVWERQRVFPEIFWDVCVSLMFFKRCSPDISAKKKKKKKACSQTKQYFFKTGVEIFILYAI